MHKAAEQRHLLTETPSSVQLGKFDNIKPVFEFIIHFIPIDRGENACKIYRNNIISSEQIFDYYFIFLNQTYQTSECYNMLAPILYFAWCVLNSITLG